MILDIYARVSTDDQNVKQQAKYLNEWCKKQGHTINKLVLDEESGRKPLLERKKFLKLIESSKKTIAEGMVIYNLDRLTRNWDDVTLIESHFRLNWERYKLLSTYDSIDFSNASGRLMFRMKMAVSCYMPEDMREKQIIGIERAKAEGKFKGRKVGAKNKGFYRRKRR